MARQVDRPEWTTLKIRKAMLTPRWQIAKENERLKAEKTKIKFHIKAVKHLPKMDRFGKTVNSRPLKGYLAHKKLHPPVGPP